jgi:hypothetical protein
MTQPIEPLDAWLKRQDKTDFPGAGKIDYFRRYEGATEWLNLNIHQHVEKSFLLQEGGFLTDHGPEHVKTVIRRASALIVDPQGKLRPYEAYLLLMAIHFHDVGNIYGRKGHESRLAEITAEMGKLLGEDSAEIRATQMIGRAHGGTINGDKDTISHLPIMEAILGEQVHMQRLAALLRFADELSDDKYRAARVLLKLKKIPKSSEIFHAYASKLHSVIVEPSSRTIELHFELDRDSAVRRFGKSTTSAYLLNEIYERAVKTHIERIYCKRYMDDIARVESVTVTVKVYLEKQHLGPIEEIKFRLEERGYPCSSPPNIKTLCPDLRWTGAELKKYLTRSKKRRQIR